METNYIVYGIIYQRLGKLDKLGFFLQFLCNYPKTLNDKYVNNKQRMNITFLKQIVELKTISTNLTKKLRFFTRMAVIDFKFVTNRNKLFMKYLVKTL